MHWHVSSMLVENWRTRRVKNRKYPGRKVEKCDLFIIPPLQKRIVGKVLIVILYFFI